MSEPIRTFNNAASVLAGLLVLVAVSTAEAQTDIDEQSMQIIDRCLEAMGGEMQLSAVESILMTGKSTHAKGGGKPLAIEHVIASGGRFSTGYVDMIMSVSDGSHRWQTRPGEPPKLETRQRGMGPAIMPYHESVLNWQQYPGKVRTVGEAAIDDQETWKLEFQLDDKTATLYFDQQSGLLVQSTVGGKSSTWFRYEYRNLNEILVLSKILIFNGTENDESTHFQTLEYDHIELNPEIPPEKFAMPEGIRRAIDNPSAPEKAKSNNDK